MIKNAKAETRGSLHKAGSDAQYEYGNDKATHQNFPNTSITLTQSVSGSKPISEQREPTCLHDWSSRDEIQLLLINNAAEDLGY